MSRVFMAVLLAFPSLGCSTLPGGRNYVMAKAEVDAMPSR